MAILKLNGPEGVIEVKVPDGELQVLTVLATLGAAHGPAISRASKGSISVAAIYKLLARLEQRGLVHKREEHVQIGDITAKRVLYEVCETLTGFSKELSNGPNQAVPSGRAHHSPMQEVESNKASAVACLP